MEDDRLKRVDRVARKLRARRAWVAGTSLLFWAVVGTLGWLFSDLVGGAYFVGLAFGVLGWIAYSTFLTDLLAVIQEDIDATRGEAFLEDLRREEKRKEDHACL